MIDPGASEYGIAAAAVVLTAGAALLAIALWRVPLLPVEAPPAWAQRRFGFALVALIFLAFDMEMIFMYPWAVVFADIGAAAFADMLVFIFLLAAGIAYAWGQGALEWDS